MVQSARKHRPRVKTVTVSQATPKYLNGTYVFTSSHGLPCYEKPYSGTSSREKGGRRSSAILPVAKSSSCIWFLTSKSSYYDAKIHFKTHSPSETEVPDTGWTCSCEEMPGLSPPCFSTDGSICPDGEEFETLEHQLAQWKICSNLYF